MNFLTPLAFLGALLAIPIILLYMLRLRRREVTISSTFLWQQVLQDQEANTPWQRLRRNLLLLLQLLILLLLVLALARPFVTVPAVSAGQVTVLLDASASMNATDTATGETRFEAAQEEVIDIINTLSAGDRMTVIRVADVPEVLAASTTNRSQLRNAVVNADPSLGEGDWEAALNLAAAGAANTDDFTVVIIGDGGLPQEAGLPGIEGEVRYVPVGNNGDNVAITALATRALAGEPPQLYAQITNYSATEARIVFTLLVDGETFAAENETVPAGGSLPIISSALPDGFSTLEASITQSVNSAITDYLPADDVAYAVAARGGDRRALLVTEGNLFIEQVLRSLPGIDVVRTDGASGIPADYDVYIFDTFAPDTLPDGDLFFINPPASTSLFTLGAQSQQTTNPRVLNTADPLMQFVDIEQLNLLQFNQIGGADWAEPLISVDGGPILLAGETGGQQVVVMPFNVRESDLPLQIAWPVLIANTMEWFTPSAAITIADSITVGDSLNIRPPFEADTVRVTSPQDTTRNLPVERETVIFADTSTPGIYQLELLNGGEVINAQPFAVNLFSPLESRIAPVSIADLSLAGTTLTTETENELGQQEFWPVIALLALLVLLVEWYAYHRRLRVPTIFAPVRRQQAAS